MKRRKTEPTGFSHRFVTLQDLKWAKALVAAITTARSTGGFRDDETLAVYKVPEFGGYTVCAVRDIATNMAWAAFVQALIRSPDYEGHGEVMSRFPKGSRRVFPPPAPRRKR